MKGRGPEGGHLWLALPSTLILQMALQVFSPRVPIWRGGWHQPPAIACPSRLTWHQSVGRVQTQQDEAAAGPHVPPLCAWLT